MKCELFRDLLLDYVDGALDADTLVDYRQHYGSCAGCAATQKMIEGQEGMLAALPHPKAPDTLWGRIQHEIADRRMLTSLDRPRLRFGGWAAAAAAALVAVSCVFAVGGRAPRREDPGLPVHVVDISAQPGAPALGRMVPGYENPVPAAPLFDTLLGAGK